MKEITKYYSEVLNKTFDNKEECLKAEKVENEKVAKEKKKKDDCELIRQHIDAYVKTYGELPKMKDYVVDEALSINEDASPFYYLQKGKDWNKMKQDIMTEWNGSNFIDKLVNLAGCYDDNTDYEYSNRGRK